MRRVAIVTGANSGIGAATAEALANRDVAVVVAYKQVPVWDTTGTPAGYNDLRMVSGEVVASSINDAGGQAVAFEADLLEEDSACALFEFAEASFGSVDILVHNASGWLRGDSFRAGVVDGAGRTSGSVTAELFDRTFGVDAGLGHC